MKQECIILQSTSTVCAAALCSPFNTSERLTRLAPGTNNLDHFRHTFHNNMVEYSSGSDLPFPLMPFSIEHAHLHKIDPSALV
ncbi:hypothetical protein CALCODRAFT_160408 [Calocera cornea HHB12733]|uniref:Uncharacterized protein n=1 Tax=Calocera cornea HHB12733 TaxID=1353952 RepID=A0A165I2R8_9BASI|nr:hypothetical protein CALCODRAFT_160408 [Calocera cornea HHB12733]